MRILLTISCFLLLTYVAKGQSDIFPERQVIASGGTYFQVSGNSLSYTIGEPVTTTLAGYQGTVFLTQGFQQPDSLSLVSVDQPHLTQLSYRVFPNPSSRWVFVELSSEVPLKLTLSLFDAKGKATNVASQNLQVIGEVQTKVDLSGLPYGIYMLRLFDPEQRVVQTFPIQKVH